MLQERAAEERIGYVSEVTQNHAQDMLRKNHRWLGDETRPFPKHEAKQE